LVGLALAFIIREEDTCKEKAKNETAREQEDYKEMTNFYLTTCLINCLFPVGLGHLLHCKISPAVACKFSLKRQTRWPLLSPI
jgi:hypothetical protein